MNKLILLLLILISSRVNAKVVIFHFTDMNGPSKESGDCGGLSVWLNLNTETATFVGGEINEYEGGCKAYPMEIIKVFHNPKTGKLSFLSNYFSDSELLKFDGYYYFESLSIKGDFFKFLKKQILRSSKKDKEYLN